MSLEESLKETMEGWAYPLFAIHVNEHMDEIGSVAFCVANFCS
jgi:hypothetical protein